MSNMIERHIKFNAELHRYTDEENKVYTSVTTVIGKYHPQFNREYWAKETARKSGLTIDQVKKNWDDITNYACDKGNKTHKTLEDSINESNGNAKFQFTDKDFRAGVPQMINSTNLHILQNSPLAKKYPRIYEFLKRYIDDGWTLFAERRVYWYEYLIAGTIDCLLVRGKMFMIVDWKTNKDELKFKSGYYKKFNGVKSTQWVDKKEYFFHPIPSIEHCKGNIYTLQLSLYALILEAWGYQCVGLTLFHIRDNADPTPYNINYLKTPALLLLQDNIKPSRNSGSTNSGTQFGIF